MAFFFEVSTTNYEEDKILIIKSLSHLQTQCEVSDGFELGKPVSRFGWTFIPLGIKTNLQSKIENKFSDMIQKTKGRKNDEKFTNFMIDFFDSRGCKIKLKQVQVD